MQPNEQKPRISPLEDENRENSLGRISKMSSRSNSDLALEDEILEHENGESIYESSSQTGEDHSHECDTINWTTNESQRRWI